MQRVGFSLRVGASVVVRGYGMDPPPRPDDALPAGTGSGSAWVAAAETIQDDVDADGDDDEEVEYVVLRFPELEDRLEPLCLHRAHFHVDGWDTASPRVVVSSQPQVPAAHTATTGTTGAAEVKQRQYHYCGKWAPASASTVAIGLRSSADGEDDAAARAEGATTRAGEARERGVLPPAARRRRTEHGIAPALHPLLVSALPPAGAASAPQAAGGNGDAHAETSPQQDHAARRRPRVVGQVVFPRRVLTARLDGAATLESRGVIDARRPPAKPQAGTGGSAPD
jgi:hypothetical protein